MTQTILTRDSENTGIERIASAVVTPANGIDRTGMTSLNLTPVTRGSFNTSSWDAIWNSGNLTTWYDDREDLLSVETINGRLAIEAEHIPDGDNGTIRINSGGILPTMATSMTVAQRVYLPDGFDYGSHPEATGKLGFGIRSTVNATGGLANPEGFSSRFIWRRVSDKVYYHMYLYTATTAGFGDDETTSFEIPTGEWVELAQEVVMNSAYGAADGTLKFWVNGVLQADKTGIEWTRTQATGEPSVPSINGLIFGSLHGGSGDPRWKPDSIQYVSYEDIAYKAS